LSNETLFDIFVGFRFTQESSRWHLTHGKADKAEKNLREIAKVNRKEYPEEKLKIPEVSQDSRFNCLALFSSLTLVICILIQAFVW
jgi:hypothetical protein